MPFVALTARWIAGLVLLAAGTNKMLQGHDRGAESIARYGPLPSACVDALATALPLMELMTSAALILGVGERIAGGMSAILFLTFSLAVAWNVSRGKTFACGCGTSDGRTISWKLVAADVCLSAASVCVASYSQSGLAIWPGPGTSAVSHTFTDLLPIPMLVCLLGIGCRLLSSVGLLSHPLTRLSGRVL